MPDLEKVIRGLEEAKEYFRECRSNASLGSKAENHFWELQSAIGDAAERLKDPDRVKVCRCENCVGWEAPPENEQMDGNTTGFCRYKYGACYGHETDMTWFCADGEEE